MLDFLKSMKKNQYLRHSLPQVSFMIDRRRKKWYHEIDLIADLKNLCEIFRNVKSSL